MSEHVYFNADGVSVSNARFVVRGTTYPIQSITSVGSLEQKPFPLPAIVLLLIGFGFLLGGHPSWLLLGPVLIGLGIVWIVKKKKLYSVVLHTASGEVTALQSPDPQQVRSVVEALNQAIVARG